VNHAQLEQVRGKLQHFNPEKLAAAFKPPEHTTPEFCLGRSALFLYVRPAAAGSNLWCHCCIQGAIRPKNRSDPYVSRTKSRPLLY
jgi:hypothetical protein